MGNFQNLCLDNDLPYEQLGKSLRDNGERIMQSKYAQTMAKKSGREKFIGWYAISET